MQAENKNFWINLGKIQDALLLSDKEFSDYLGISYAHYTKQKNALNFLPINCVFECAEKLNFHFEDLLQERFSTKAILSKIQGNYSMPEKYSVANYSTTRPIMNVLSYLAREKGERCKINLLRKFQISDLFFDNQDQKTNILLITDIVRYLTTTYQLKPSDLLAIGQMTPLTITNKDFRHGLICKNNIYELIDFFVNDCAGLFDKNYSYQIEKMTNDYAIVEAIPNKNVIQELQLPLTQFGSEGVCHTRMGVLSSITWLKYKRFANVKKISSLYAKDNCNRYIIDLAPFSNLCNLAGAHSDTSAIYH